MDQWTTADLFLEFSRTANEEAARDSFGIPAARSIYQRPQKSQLLGVRSVPQRLMKLRQRLREMNDAELIRFGRACAQQVTGDPLHLVLVELEEA